MDKKDVSIKELLFGEERKSIEDSEKDEESTSVVTEMPIKDQADLELPAESKLENLSLFSMVTMPGSMNASPLPVSTDTTMFSVLPHQMQPSKLSSPNRSPVKDINSPQNMTSPLQGRYTPASASLSPTPFSPKDTACSASMLNPYHTIQSRLGAPSTPCSFSQNSMEPSKFDIFASLPSNSDELNGQNSSLHMTEMPHLDFNGNNFLGSSSVQNSCQSPKSLEAGFSTMDTEDISIANNFMLLPPNTSGSSHCAHKLNSSQAPVSACSDSYSALSPSSSHSSYGRGYDYDSNPLLGKVSAVSNPRKISHSPSTPSESSPFRFRRGSSSSAHHSDSSSYGCSDGNKKSGGLAGVILEDNSSKSDSGVGDMSSSASESQHSPPSYSYLTPWTNKVLATDYVPLAPPTQESLPVPLDSYSQTSMLAISPRMLETPLRSSNSRHYQSYSRIQAHQKANNVNENVGKKASASTHKSKVPSKEHRFRRTAEALHKSGLWEVAMKTGNLMKRNQELQKELDLFRLDALAFLKSVIKNPENRDFIKNVLNTALSSNNPRKSKPSVMSVVVSAAAAAVKLEANSPHPSEASCPTVPANTETMPKELLEDNFLGVKAASVAAPLRMDLD